jgi:enoyl-CoA hydratase/carnithine racemase
VEVGFLDQVVEPDQVSDRALTLARDLAGRLQVDAYRATGRALRSATAQALEGLAFRPPD